MTSSRSRKETDATVPVELADVPVLLAEPSAGNNEGVQLEVADPEELSDVTESEEVSVVEARIERSRRSEGNVAVSTQVVVTATEDRVAEV